MLNLQTSTHRRGFLGGIAAGAAALGLGALVPRSLQAESPQSGASRDPAYDAWLARIVGQHKMVFDAPEPNDGMPVVWPRVWLTTTNATFGTTDAQNRAVIVLRHGAIGFALRDAAWASYRLGEFFKIDDGAAPATRNPWFKPLPLPLPGTGIEALMAAGVLVAACDMALTVYSQRVAQLMQTNATMVKADWIANVIPGIQVVPSGVLAVNGAQEKGCSYCFAG